MIIVANKRGLIRFNPLPARFKPLNVKTGFPRLRTSGIVSITLIGTTKIIAESLFKSLPGIKDMDEVIYTGDMALFVWMNLKNYYSKMKNPDKRKSIQQNLN